MSEPDDSARLRRLEARIAALKPAPDAPQTQEHYSQAQIGWRMVTELVAGIGIGFAIGLGLDTLFGTTPIFMVVFLMFGLAAGVKVMLRTATELGGSHGAGQQNAATHGANPAPTSDTKEG